MRMLPYAKALVARRAAGERPWLVLVTMGTEADKKLMRMPFAKDRELHRIWVPDDFRITEADLSWAVGLDVFVAPWTEPERMTQFMVLLWRARVATLWQLDAGFTATRLFPAGRYQELLAFTPARVKLDEGFRRRVEQTRALALMCADEPLFQDPLFSSERSKLLAA
jgi:hypothetical protein